ncbi:hypothetical protein NDK43_07065 [Neobacillus pocheonensis]|uniref:Uncharacterized protein n=1 Tax=Neobacillus pocheonensis TaxID=363869 RepID=A0ABT0W7A0_9BACI|nr:hypothetical protein [Neobacillus pocheonensis]
MSKSSGTKTQTRDVAAFISPLSINYLHIRNPWVSAFWSAAFPGFGQIMMCKYIIGYGLISWEFFINQKSGINLAILYSMIGEFDQAKHVINSRWFLLYIPLYIYGIWDSFTRTNLYKKDYILSYKKGYPVISKNINTFELNKLEKRNPFFSMVWSIFTPGMGYLYINRLLSVLVFLLWFIAIVYFSKLLPAIQLTMVGNFQASKQILDPQWLLYIPSIYLFVIYDYYVQTIEYNKIFEKEQAFYFKKEYQNKDFIMPN